MDTDVIAIADGITAPAVEVEGLSKTYPGGTEAVKAIDFTVASGEVFGLLGPNGAGKSTTIGMLTTTIEPTSGSARLGRFHVGSDPQTARPAHPNGKAHHLNPHPPITLMPCFSFEKKNQLHESVLQRV